MTEDYSEDANEFRCIVPFPDQHPSFCTGFEAGMIWQRMIAGETKIGGDDEVAMHRDNREVFERMAAAQGYDFSAEEIDDIWSIFTFSKRRQRFRAIAGGLSTASPNSASENENG